MYRFLTTVIFASFIWSSSVIPADGARLLIVSGNINSHVLLFSRLGADLAKFGHDVRLLAPSTARVPDFVQRQQQQEKQQRQTTDNPPSTENVNPGWGQFNYTTFEVEGDKPHANSPEISKEVVDIAMTESTVWRFFRTLRFYVKPDNSWDADGRRLVENETIIDDLRKGQFDFVLLDILSPPYLFIPSLLFGVPYGVVGISCHAVAVRVPRLPSFVSNTFFDSGDPVSSFSTRVVNSFAELAIHAALSQKQIVIRDSRDDTADSYIEMPMIRGMQKASLWFFVDDVSVTDASPNMPNTASVGDIAAGRPGLPLPDDLEQFVAASKGGVIVVSFGSYCDFLPDTVNEKLCDAFRRLQSDGRRVVWKSSKPGLCVGAENVRIIPWIPQNDLLADRRVALFVTHGGFNSLIEALYHAKPMIIFPLFVDQSTNADSVVRKGYGIRMGLSDFTADSLLNNINTILSDVSFRMSVRLASWILSDRPDTPAERVSRLIDHVIKYGDNHLRSRALELNIFQFFMLDVIAVSIAASFIIIVSLRLVCRYTCCKRKSNRVKGKRD